MEEEQYKDTNGLEITFKIGIDKKHIESMNVILNDIECAIEDMLEEKFKNVCFSLGGKGKYIKIKSK